MVHTWQARRNEATAIPPPTNEFHSESMFVHPESYPRYPSSTTSYILLHCNVFARISTQIRHIKQKINKTVSILWDSKRSPEKYGRTVQQPAHGGGRQANRLEEFADWRKERGGRRWS